MSPELHARSLPDLLCMLPMSVARSSGMLTIGRIAYRREGVFFPIDNALTRSLQKGSFDRQYNVMQHNHSVAAVFAENGIGREGGDGSAQRGRIYDCLATDCRRTNTCINKNIMSVSAAQGGHN